MPPEDVREIIKQLEAVTHRGYSAWNVFEDWVALMFWAIQRNDEEYLKIVRRYKNDRPQAEREIDYFCNAFGLLMEKMAGTNRELLGEIYMQWEVSNKHTGQYFTPWHVAFMMAQMLGPKGESINDCCCGSGIMFVAACKTMTNQQLDKAVFVGQDIDLTCVMMCALNLTFFNLNGYVIWGNSFTNERRKIFQTTRSYLGGSLVEVPVESIPLPEIPERVIEEPKKLTKRDRQPVLF
jgi:type I restriction-modification system DNA methylase subunit